jgi:large subunit ribosomal protein L15
MQLNDIKPAAGAKHAKRRVGRGIGSGLGKTAGRGNKGHKARSGGQTSPGFEGGQMPLYRRLPKRGFNKPNAKSYTVVNLGMIQKFIAEGKLDAAQPITAEAMVASGLIRRVLDGVRVLAKGEITSAVTLTVTGASAAAVEAVAAAGGTLTVAEALPPHGKPVRKTKVE